MSNFRPFLSPDAIDLSLCAMTVGDSAHNQAKANGITEKKDITIIHYYPEENENDKFLFWYGKSLNIFTKSNVEHYLIQFDLALRKWKEILLGDLPSSLDLTAISNFCTRGKFLFLKSRPQEGLRIICPVHIIRYRLYDMVTYHLNWNFWKTLI